MYCYENDAWCKRKVMPKWQKLGSVKPDSAQQMSAYTGHIVTSLEGLYQYFTLSAEGEQNAFTSI